MNIKKYSLKIMCAALACTTVLSSMLVAYATNTTVYETPMDDSAEINSIDALSDDSTGAGSSDSGWTTEENSFEDIKVTYQQSSSYTVTIPKTIALGSEKQAAYSVKVSGDIDANQRVYVAPVDGIADSENLDFYMSDLSGKKANAVATVTQSKTYWNSEDVTAAYEETNNSVSAPDLTAGTWEGTFQVEIRLETEKEQEHTHNYVDGKCECGAIDPNHTHNYEDGTCTICGEKDSYTTAPENAYTNWNYTLDNTNNVITLNYYTGSETDVMVYANYVINGKIYKTQIASNKSTSDYKTLYMFNGDGRTGTTSSSFVSKSRYIKSIKFSNDIDTSNVTNMSYMFNGCETLTDLDVSCFDTSNVTDMQWMFRNCESLTHFDINNFNTSKVTNMQWMFSYCDALTSIDLSNFDTSNVTNMSSMFHSSSNLVSLDLSNFDTSSVTNISYMFDTCSNLANLNLSSFDTSKVTDMTAMFQHCTALSTVYVTEGKWSTAQAKTSYMFNNCGISSVTYK